MTWTRRGTRPTRLDAVDVWREDPRNLANHLSTVVLTLGMGIACLVADPMDFSSPSYATIRATAGIAAWGIAMVIGGIWLGAASLWTKGSVRWALLVTGCLHVIVAGTFYFSAATNDGASPLGWMLFGGLALRHVMQALFFPKAPTKPRDTEPLKVADYADKT